MFFAISIVARSGHGLLTIRVALRVHKTYFFVSMLSLRKVAFVAAVFTGSHVALTSRAAEPRGPENLELPGREARELAQRKLNRKHCETVSPYLHQGDLLFTYVANPLYRKVAQFSGGWASHVGIAFQKKGRWVVAESHFTGSSYTDFCHFLARSDQERFAIRRLKIALNDEQITRLRIAANYRMGRGYDLGFDLSSPSRLFCSRFVFEVFHEALGLKIGKAQSFRDLYNERAKELGRAPAMTFWKIWFWGEIPWQRRTLTPRSQYEDPQLVTVLDTTLSRS
jgi:hypothetical protein